MSQAKLESPVAELHGKYSKDGTIFRQKKYRSETGAVLHTCVQEAYVVDFPRDFKKNPPKGSELANMKRFGEAHRRSLALIKAGKLTPDELAALLHERAEQLRHGMTDDTQRIDAGAPLRPLGAGKVCEWCPARGLCRRDWWCAPQAENTPEKGDE